MIEGGFRPKSLRLGLYRPTIHVITVTFLRCLRFFLKIQKRDFLRSFALLQTFSRTILSVLLPTRSQFSLDFDET